MSNQRKRGSSISSAGVRTPGGVRAQAVESSGKRKAGRKRSGKKSKVKRRSITPEERRASVDVNGKIKRDLCDPFKRAPLEEP